MSDAETKGGAGKVQPRPTIKAVRGTRDLLPDQTPLWNHVESTARAIFARYGFGEIRTPIFEDTSLFSRAVGEETDIVSKEMFTWEDGERFDKTAAEDAWLRTVDISSSARGADEPMSVEGHQENPGDPFWRALVEVVGRFDI